MAIVTLPTRSDDRGLYIYSVSDILHAKISETENTTESGNLKALRLKKEVCDLIKVCFP